MKRAGWRGWAAVASGWLALGSVKGAEIAPTNLVRGIEIVTSRVSPAVVRRELIFREGEPLTGEKIEESRANLHRLGLFKTLELNSEWDAALEGYRVTVRGEDGWFIMPGGMLGSRGGEPFGALGLVERNYLRQGEGLALFGMLTETRRSGWASFSLPRCRVGAGGSDSRGTEHEYDDGAFSARQIGGDLFGGEADDYGTVTNRFRKHIRQTVVLTSARWGQWLRPGLSVTATDVEYRPDEDEGVGVPADAGDYVTWTVSLGMGRDGRVEPASQGGLVALSRVFGLGMAAVKDSLTPLPAVETRLTGLVSLEHAEPGWGSDDAFTKAMGTATLSTLFRDRSQLLVSVKGGWGDEPPPSQRLGTAQRGLLTGVYAREYRGDNLAAATVSYTKPVLRNMLGILNVEAFGDAAWCWTSDDQWEQRGLGLNLVYRFWRFPLPLGGGATYSFDDGSWQYSFAIGRMM
jgi:outer membrane protein assembly factor BamA